MNQEEVARKLEEESPQILRRAKWVCLMIVWDRVGNTVSEEFWERLELADWALPNGVSGRFKIHVNKGQLAKVFYETIHSSN